MKLYHGSNQAIRQPDLLKGRKYLDFGSGFYLSDEKSQAENRAKSAVLFFEKGESTVNVYEWDNKNLAGLKILRFPGANIEWLDFVLANRQANVTPSGEYDIVIGPTANDKTILVIEQYVSGMFDHLENPKNMVIQLFQPQKLATQYLFATGRSLEFIRFTSSYTL